MGFRQAVVQGRQGICGVAWAWAPCCVLLGKSPAPLILPCKAGPYAVPWSMDGRSQWGKMHEPFSISWSQNMSLASPPLVSPLRAFTPSQLCLLPFPWRHCPPPTQRSWASSLWPLPSAHRAGPCAPRCPEPCWDCGKRGFS